MYTSIVLIALVGSADAKLASPAAPAWQTDYATAQKRGVAEKKPLAVVVGRGSSGWNTLSRDGKFDASVTDALHNNYVCVYIDADTDSGQKLADSFEMKGGLVLSDRSGDKQAFRHEGTLTNSDLQGVLKRFADPERVVTRTETHGQAEVRYYPSDAAPAPTSGTVPSYFVPASSGSYCPSCQRR